MPKLVPLTAIERATLVKRIRFELGIRLGRQVTQAEFARMVSDIVGLAKPLSMMAAHGWEKGAEPGFMAGCAIAHLGGLPAEALAFKRVGGDSQPAAETSALRGGRRPTVAEAMAQDDAARAVLAMADATKRSRTPASAAAIAGGTRKKRRS